jgi:hypothetical protein
MPESASSIWIWFSPSSSSLSSMSTYPSDLEREEEGRRGKKERRGEKRREEEEEKEYLIPIYTFVGRLFDVWFL